MAKDLERDLGLYAVVTVSMGAMIGSGIFVLPALATKITGPAVVLAYLLAGVFVLPAALSKAEMATAMPESGGTYLYIDRGMGPVLGTIAGLGTWFSLVFKSSFALVGLGAYLLLFLPLPTKPVALGLAVLLILVNVVGAKQTGRLQAIIVSLVLSVMAGFVGLGIINVDDALYQPFFTHGIPGLLKATGFVFVSYAGVTKIASIAEEVEDPGRNIPLGILVSIGVMMLIYTLVVLVIAGVATPDQLGHTLTPMAVAARQIAGPIGVTVVATTAVLALTGMANAGILSSSRYPLAMSRDDLAPERLSRISARFGTPIGSITLTGAVILLLIAAVPVLELAKLASAFTILIFIMVNVALIAFREADLDWYDPEFTAPLYPWVQLFGIAGGLVLITTMGTIPMIGAAAIFGIGLVWFQLYGREGVEREGAAVDALRRTAKERSATRLESSIRGDQYRVLVPVADRIDEETERSLVRVAAAMAERKNGSVTVIRFEEVPDQTTLSAAADAMDPDDIEFEEMTNTVAAAVDVPVEVGEVVSHDSRHAINNYANHHAIDLILAPWTREFHGNAGDWLMEHAPCDVAFLQDRGTDRIGHITVVINRDEFDPLQLKLADGLATAHDAVVELLYLLPGDVPDARTAAAEDYLAEVVPVFEHNVSAHVIHTDDPVEDVVDHAADTDILIGRESAHNRLRDAVFGHFPDAIAERAACTVVLTRTASSRTHSFIRYLIDRYLY